MLPMLPMFPMLPGKALSMASFTMACMHASKLFFLLFTCIETTKVYIVCIRGVYRIFNNSKLLL